MKAATGGPRGWSCGPTRCKPLTAIKGVVPDTGRGTVIIGFGDHVDDARYVLLTVPDAHELVRMVQGALDAPFPIGS